MKERIKELLSKYPKDYFSWRSLRDVNKLADYLANAGVVVIDKCKPCENDLLKAGMYIGDVACGATIDVIKLQNEVYDLKQQLKNAIIPKFKIGQEIWCDGKWLDGDEKVASFKVENIKVFVCNDGTPHFKYYREHTDFDGDKSTMNMNVELFTTKAEAEQALKGGEK